MNPAQLIRKWWFWPFAAILVYYLLMRAPLPLIDSWWRWKEGGDRWNDDWHLRHRMADGMLLSRSLLGLNRSEVIDKLGEPTRTGKFRNWSLAYNLGSERSLISIDSEWLLIKLDHSDRVVFARLMTD